MSRALNYCVLASAIVGLLVAGGPARAGVWYVDDDAAGAGTGLNWDDAFIYLQDALAVAQDGDDIRVAQGVYRPDQRSDWPPGGSGDRAATFWLISGVGLYGGYAGVGASDPDERDITLYETILSGDLAENDGPDFANYEENSHHVVTAVAVSAATTLGGFTIIGGNADDYADDSDGGGIRNYGGGLLVSGCALVRNLANYGGGMSNGSGSAPLLVDCVFRENAGSTGAGMVTFQGSSPTLIACVFTGNIGVGYFSDAGGIYNSGNSDVLLVGCTFVGNVADFGGAIQSRESNLTSVNCLFSGNSAGYGGVIWNYSSLSSLMCCTLAGNSANDDGSAVYSAQYSSVTVHDSIIWDEGGEFYNDSYSQLEVVFSDVRDGWPGDGNIDEDPLFLDANGADGVPGTEDDDLRLSVASPCINAGPFYASDLPEGDIEGNPRVLNCRVDMGAFESPYPPVSFFDCNDNAEDDDCDIAENASLDCNRNEIPDECDIDDGASADDDGNGIPDECESATLYVDDTANGMGLGTTWEHAYNDLQTALEIASLPGVAVEEIRLAQGIYHPDQGSSARVASFRLLSGVAVRGGYAGAGASDPDARDIEAYETILSGDLAENDGPGEWENYDENSYHVVVASGTDSSAVLDGLTVMAGFADDGPFQDEHDYGAGLLNNGGSPTLTNCTFRLNRAYQGGGGVLNVNASGATLAACLFEANRASAGAGMLSSSSSPALTDCMFLGNYASGCCGGGGMYNIANSNPTLSNCTFLQNSAKYDGGAMRNANSSPSLIACRFIENEALSGAFAEGGAMHNSGASSPFLNHCDFTGNHAGEAGGAICNRGSSTHPTISACAFTANSAGESGGAFYLSESRPTMLNCVLTANEAPSGGAMFIDDCWWPELISCTFVGNTATNGRALAFDSHGHDYSSHIEMIGCILWDGGEEIWVGDYTEPTAAYTDIQGGWPGEGNINADPLFVGYPDDGGDGWGDDPDTPDVDEGANDDYGDLHLLAGSPCINTGSNYTPGLPEEDFEGNPRIQQCRVDMGAYESPYAPTAFPDCNENGLDDDCEVYAGSVGDCNENHVVDECDIAQGTSYDADGSGVPDECEDCNGNGVPDALDPSQSLFSNVGAWVGALDTTAPVAQDIHLPGRAQLRTFRVHYTSTGSSPGNMMVRFYQGGTDGSVVPVYPEGLLDEYSLGRLSWLPGDESSYKHLEIEPALPLPSHLWMEVEISREGGVMLRSEPPTVGFTQGLVYDRDAGEMLVGPLYMGLKIEGLQCELDCNGNSIEDACDVACGPVGGPCDVLGCGQSDDCNANGVPDECEPDCNDNGVADECDIIAGTSDDDNDNGTPDECEPAVDLKPGACPNSFNRNSHGVLPVGLLGTEELDIMEVDPSTVRLSRADGRGGSVAPHEGPPGPHSVYKDVGTPFEGEPCACHDAAGDGILDLSMKFKTDDVTANLLLNELAPGALVELVVRGNLLDGSVFAGSDCIRLVPPGTPPGLVGIQSNAAGAWIEVEPLDLQLDGGGFTDFERSYPLGSVVTLTAEPTHEAKRLVGWRLDGEFQMTDSSVGFTTTEDLHTVEVVLLRWGDMDGDDHVDLADFATFATCYGLGGPHAECEAQEFAACDLDADGLVDLSDFATFALSFGS